MEEDKNYVGKYLRITIEDHKAIKTYISPRGETFQSFIEKAIKNEIERVNNLYKK